MSSRTCINRRCTLAGWLAGEFDSTEQADEDPRYFAISLSACPVTAPSLGGRALYVEQAYMDDLENPYRQRIYTVQAPAEDEATASTTVYALEAPGDFVGACGEGVGPSLDASDVSLRPGCGVVVQWSDAEEAFVGGTEGTDCASSINGASYATSDVRIEADLVSSWDRGFDDEGEQVWGATAGPYVFRRSESSLR